MNGGRGSRGGHFDDLAKTFVTVRRSRRDALKLGMGAVAAAAVASLPTRAGADEFTECRDFNCGKYPCGNFSAKPCGVNPDTGNCVCSQTTSGTCRCFQPICLQSPCTTNADCPSGFKCVRCCEQATCAPLCNTRLSYGGGAAPAADFTRWAA